MGSIQKQWEYFLKNTCYLTSIQLSLIFYKIKQLTFHMADLVFSPLFIILLKLTFWNAVKILSQFPHFSSEMPNRNFLMPLVIFKNWGKLQGAKSEIYSSWGVMGYQMKYLSEILHLQQNSISNSSIRIREKVFGIELIS